MGGYKSIGLPRSPMHLIGFLNRFASDLSSLPPFTTGLQILSTHTLSKPILAIFEDFGEIDDSTSHSPFGLQSLHDGDEIDGYEEEKWFSTKPVGIWDHYRRIVGHGCRSMKPLHEDKQKLWDTIPTIDRWLPCKKILLQLEPGSIVPFLINSYSHTHRFGGCLEDTCVPNF